MKKIIHKALWQMLGLIVISSVVGIAANQVRPGGISLRPSEVEVSGVGFLEDRMIRLEEAREGFQSKGSLFVDARSPELFGQGHIPGARNLPWAEVIQNPGAALGFPKDTQIIVYDEGQEVSAVNLAAFLTSLGHKSTRILDGGWSGWKKAGFQVESAK